MEELKYAAAILKIAETQNISRAAEKLFISQPAMSRILRHVEKSLGFELFDRSSYPLKPTVQGSMYLHYLAEITEMEKQMLVQVKLLSEQPKAVVHVGIVPERGLEIYSKIFPELVHECPDLEIMIQNGFSDDLERLFLNGKLDICILNGPLQKEVDHKIILDREEILLIISKKNPLSETLLRRAEDESNVNISALQNQGFVVLNEGQRMRQIVSSILSLNKIQPSKMIEVFNLSTAAKLVASGNFLSFVPKSFLYKSGVKDELFGFSVGSPPYAWEFMLLYTDQSNNSLAQKIAQKYYAMRQKEARLS